MKRQETAERQLAAYLPKGSKVTVVQYGVMLDVEVEYMDFKSVPEVRKWMDRHIPDVNNITLWRSYSDRVVTEVLQRLYDVDSEVQMKVESLLFAENLADGEENDTCEEEEEHEGMKE